VISVPIEDGGFGFMEQSQRQLRYNVEVLNGEKLAGTRAELKADVGPLDILVAYISQTTQQLSTL